MKKTIYYSVQNGGDGSAYPQLMESMELAEWDQDHMDEGWGENCTRTIEVESDSEITIIDKVTTKESYVLEMIDGYSPNENRINEFVEEFFPDGLPEFGLIDTGETFGGDQIYKRWNVIVESDSEEDTVVDRISRREDLTRQEIHESINRFRR